jgi:hypothetical protein
MLFLPLDVVNNLHEFGLAGAGTPPPRDEVVPKMNSGNRARDPIRRRPHFMYDQRLSECRRRSSNWRPAVGDFLEEAFMLLPGHFRRFRPAVLAAIAGFGAVCGAIAESNVFRQQQLRSRDGSALVNIIPTAGPDSATPLSAPTAPAGPSTRGVIWEQMTCPPGVYVKAVSMASPRVGFAAAELGIALRSTDGGNTWQTVLNDGFPFYYYGVQAFSETTIVLTGFNNQTGEGVVRWSDTGGSTWGPVVALSAPSFLDWLFMVRFADANRGVVQSFSGGIFYTTNGGRAAGDWTFVQASQNWWNGTFTFLDDGRVWMTGYDNYRSPNGGATWDVIADADPVFDGPNGMLPDGTGFVGGGSISPEVAGWLYATSDGGDSWSPSPVLTTEYPIRGIYCLDENRAWAVGGNVYTSVGGIWGTVNGGATWQLERNTGAEMLDITTVRVSPTLVDAYAVGQVSQMWRAHVTTPSTPGDIDGDGDVDLADLAALLSSFGLCSGDAGFVTAADIDANGCVDLADLTLLLSNYGV